MTFLSNYVKCIFVDAFSKDENDIIDSMQSLTFKAVLNTFECHSCFLKISNLQKKKEFLSEVKCLNDIFIDISRIQYTVLEINQFSKEISTWMSSVTEPQVKRWLESLSSVNEAERHLHLLEMTAALERGLGNFYLIRRKPCPFLLRDLIQSEELKAVFGEKIMHLLSVMFGGPLSLNLRNLLWHGFLSQGELNKLHLSVLLFALVYLSLHISKHNLMLDLKLRNIVEKGEEMSLLKNQFCDFSIFTDLEEIMLLFEKSRFVPSSTHFIFQFSIDLFAKRRFGDCVVLMLPRVESLLRFQYACCNNCTGRILTAESTEFYTTIDQVLEENLKDGSANKIKDCLDRHVFMLIKDMFTFPEGCRIRDHVSHGEMKLRDLDEVISSLVILLAVLLAHQRHSEESSKFDAATSCGNSCPCHASTVFKKFHNSIQAYQPQFHPLSFAKRNALSCLHACTEAAFTRFDCDVTCTSLNEQLCVTLDSMTSKYIRPFIDPNNDVITWIDTFQKRELIILFRNHCNDVIIRQISHQMLQMKLNIEDNMKRKVALYKTRSMRSRHRNNFKRLISNFPLLIAALKFLSCLVLSLIHQTPVLDSFSTRKLKGVLQICENSATFTSVDVNKWDDCVALVTKLSEYISG